MTDKPLDTFEDELDAIRLSIYEEIKDMTPEEEIAYFHEHTAPIIQEFHITRSTLKPVKPHKRERISG